MTMVAANGTNNMRLYISQQNDQIVVGAGEMELSFVRGSLWTLRCVLMHKGIRGRSVSSNDGGLLTISKAGQYRVALSRNEEVAVLKIKDKDFESFLVDAVTDIVAAQGCPKPEAGLEVRPIIDDLVH